MINELYSKRSANLEEIIDGSDNPSKKDILDSKDFQVNLIDDLVNKKNIANWSVHEKSGSVDDLSKGEDEFTIDYTFNFTYKYKEVKIPLVLYINGQVDVKQMDHYSGKSKAPIDFENLGRSLDLALFDDDGDEISLSWLTSELETKVVKSIISPYL